MEKEKSCGTMCFNQNKILMVKHNKGHWAFPKGHVEENETEQETALRETKEETGLIVSIEDLITEFENHFRLFKCNILKETNKFDKKEITEIRYFSKEEILELMKEHKKDLIRMALMLHDGFKSGLIKSDHTCSEHPVLMSNFILENKDKLLINEEDAKFVASLIITHMGPWNTNSYSDIVLPLPKTREELLVHLCDYIASRNFLSVHFENNEICDSVDRGMSLSLSRKTDSKNKE